MFSVQVMSCVATARIKKILRDVTIAPELSRRMQVRLPTAPVRLGSSIMRLKFFTALLAGTALVAGVAVAGAQEHGRGMGGGGPAIHQAPSGGGWAGGHGGGFSHEPGMSMQGRAGGQIGGFNQPRSFGQGTLHGQQGRGFAQQDGMRGEHFGNRSYGVRSGTMNENRGRSFDNERGYNRQTFSD